MILYDLLYGACAYRYTPKKYNEYNNIFNTYNKGRNWFYSDTVHVQSCSINLNGPSCLENSTIRKRLPFTDQFLKKYQTNEPFGKWST